MAVLKPTSGSTITPVSVTDMYDSVKDKVNAIDAISVGESALGAHVLPSCIPNLVGTTTSGASNSALTVTAGPVTITKASHPTMIAETQADVVGNSWATIVEITKTGGYTLPPCKVLVMFDASISHIARDTADAELGQAWFSVYYTVNYGGSDVVSWEVGNMGMVHSGYNITSATTAVTSPLVHKPVSVWFLIDKTHLTADWKIVNIKAVGAVGTGDQAHTSRPTSVTFKNANLSFVALHKDT